MDKWDNHFLLKSLVLSCSITLFFSIPHHELHLRRPTDVNLAELPELSALSSCMHPHVFYLISVEGISVLNMFLFLFLRLFLFIHERHTERERQRHRQREKQEPCREPDVGLDPWSPRSHPGLKEAINRWATRAALSSTCYPLLNLSALLIRKGGLPALGGWENFWNRVGKAHTGFTNIKYPWGSYITLFSLFF